MRIKWHYALSLALRSGLCSTAALSYIVVGLSIAPINLAFSQAKKPSPRAVVTKPAVKAPAQSPSRIVDVKAQKMEINEKAHQTLFSGNVVAVKGDVTLNSATLLVDYAENLQADGTSQQDVTFLDAKDNIVITTSKQTITGNSAKMDVKANKLVVEGSVKVVQGKVTLTGERFDSDLNTNKSVMSGGDVHGVFAPR